MIRRNFIVFWDYVACKFVPNYTSLISPMFELLTKDVSFNWSSEVDKSFQAVKKIINSPTLQPFNLQLQTYVKSDASDKGTGAILSQVSNSGEEKVVAFWSRQFSSSERKYSTTEKEALAAANTVELFLWGLHFTLRTDHSAIKTILSSNYCGGPGALIARWKSLLMPYSYTIQHVPGRNLRGADAITRLPIIASDGLSAENDEVEIIALLHDQDLSAISEDIVRDASEKDEELCALHLQLEKGFPNSLKNCNELVSPYFKICHELSTYGWVTLKRG